MNEQPVAPQTFDIQIRWDTDQRDVPMVVNQAVLRPGIGVGDAQSQGVYLQLGHVNPPMDDPEDGMVLPVVPLGHYFLTESALRQLAESCSAALKDLEAQHGTLGE